MREEGNAAIPPSPCSAYLKAARAAASAPARTRSLTRSAVIVGPESTQCLPREKRGSPRKASHMSEPIISVSGLRGIVGESLTPETAIRYVGAYASTLPPGPIVITRDGRATGRWLADVIRGGLAAIGRNCI